MKTFLISFVACLLICANARAQKIRQNFEKGFSDQYKAENTLGQYAFGYNEDHTSGGSFRRETGDRFGNKVGSYGLRIADGRIRIVNYVADHNGYRADVMTNEPGVSNQNSNGYFAITKKGFRGVMIPGFRNSAEAPHVTFSRANVDGPHDSSNIGNIHEQRSTFSKNIAEPHTVNHGNIDQQHSTFSKSTDNAHFDANRGNINEQRTTFSKSIGEPHANANHGNIDQQHSTFSKSTDNVHFDANSGNIHEQLTTFSKSEPHTNANHGNINQQRPAYSKSIDEVHSNDNIHEQRPTFTKNVDEARVSVDHGNINEEHPTFSQGNINEPRGSFNHGSIDEPQNAFGKDHKEVSSGTFIQGNIDEPVVAIPLENGLEEATWEDSTHEYDSGFEDSTQGYDSGVEDSTQGYDSGVEYSKFYAQGNAVSEVDGARGHRVPDLLKDSEHRRNSVNGEHRQSYTVDLPEFLTESSATEAAIKDISGSTTSTRKRSLTRQHD